MSLSLTTFLSLFFKAGTYALIFNEVRGAVLAVPVLYAMYQSGGSAMAMWLGFCSLVGIALSVVVPLVAVKRLERFAQQKLAKVPATAG